MRSERFSKADRLLRSWCWYRGVIGRGHGASDGKMRKRIERATYNAQVVAVGTCTRGK